MLPKILSSHHISAQLFRYTAVAAVGLAADFLTLIVMTELLGLFYLIGVWGGFIVGLTITYLLSNALVFGDPKGSKVNAFIIFGVIGLVGLGLLSILVWVLTSKLGINYILSKSIATIVVFTWNFLARRKLYH